MDRVIAHILHSLLIAASLTLAACGESGLSQSDAEAQIKLYLREKDSKPFAFQVVYNPLDQSLSPMSYFAYVGSNNEPPDARENTLRYRPGLSKLIEDGLVTPLQYAGNDHQFPQYRVSITEKAAPYLGDCSHEPFFDEQKDVCAREVERSLIGITGIGAPAPSGRPGGMVSTVPFTWNEKRTPFGVAKYDTSVNSQEKESGETGEGVAIFQLFDNGWRLMDVQ